MQSEKPLEAGDLVKLIDPQPAWFATSVTIELQNLSWPRKVIRVVETISDTDYNYESDTFCEIDGFDRKLRIDRFYRVEWQYRRCGQYMYRWYEGLPIETTIHATTPMSWSVSQYYKTWQDCINDLESYPCNANGEPLVNNTNNTNIDKLKEHIEILEQRIKREWESHDQSRITYNEVMEIKSNEIRQLKHDIHVLKSENQRLNHKFNILRNKFQPIYWKEKGKNKPSWRYDIDNDVICEINIPNPCGQIQAYGIEQMDLEYTRCDETGKTV